MKYCDKCGKELADDVRVCPNCGNDTEKRVLVQQTIMQSPKESKSNGMAIAGFVCAFFIPLLGLIFGIIGLINSKRLGSGLGLSIAAVIISIIPLLIVSIILIALL